MIQEVPYTELTDTNCAARMKCAKLLLQKFPQYATYFIFFTEKRVFLVTSPDIRQNKVSGRLWGLLKKLSVFLSAGTARSAAAWPPADTACVPQLSEQLINTKLCPAFLRKFVCHLRCVLFLFFKYKLFIKILSSSLNVMLVVDKHCSDVSGDDFLMPQIDRKVNM